MGAAGISKFHAPGAAPADIADQVEVGNRVYTWGIKRHSALAGFEFVFGDDVAIDAAAAAEHKGIAQTYCFADHQIGVNFDGGDAVSQGLDGGLHLVGAGGAVIVPAVVGVGAQALYQARLCRVVQAHSAFGGFVGNRDITARQVGLLARRGGFSVTCGAVFGQQRINVSGKTVAVARKAFSIVDGAISGCLEHHIVSAGFPRTRPLVNPASHDVGAGTCIGQPAIVAASHFSHQTRWGRITQGHQRFINHRGIGEVDIVATGEGGGLNLMAAAAAVFARDVDPEFVLEFDDVFCARRFFTAIGKVVAAGGRWRRVIGGDFAATARTTATTQ